jgi:hypothetical protein
MDALKEHIQMNYTLSDLPKGHQERFEVKLKQNFPNQTSFNFSILLYAAAVIIFLFSILIVLQNNNNNKFRSNLILVNENAEVIESEKYLQNQIAIRLSEIDSIKLVGEDSYNIKNEIKELDESLEILKNDLKQTPGDQRIVDAVINTYMLKIETLDNIVNILHKYS